MVHSESNFSQTDPFDPELLKYTGIKNVFKSWFWRSYDHLGHIILYNFIWAGCLTCLDYFVWNRGWCGSWQKLNTPVIFVLFLFNSGISVGWAYIIFKIINERTANIKDYFIGVKSYLIKALGITGITFLLFLIAYYDFLFYITLLNRQNILVYLTFGLTTWILLFLACCTLYQFPLLFFQDPPFWKIYYRSGILVIGNIWLALFMVIFFLISFSLFMAVPVAWFFGGLAYFFSFQCVVLEKSLIKYKITFRDRPLREFLQFLETENNRGWRQFFRPWEH